MFRRTGKEPFFSYWSLTYRKKFLRSLWMFPFAFIFFLLPADLIYFGLSRNALTAIVFIFLLIQIGYTFYRWKTTER